MTLDVVSISKRNINDHKIIHNDPITECLHLSIPRTPSVVISKTVVTLG